MHIETETPMTDQALPPIPDDGGVVTEVREAAGTGETMEATDGPDLDASGQGGQIPLAGGAGIAIEMARANAAEDLARAEEGVLSYGYDQTRAWVEVADLNRRVVEAREQWESDKKTAAASKKDHDELVETLTKRISTLDVERRKPKLAFTGVEPGVGAPSSLCAFERETGMPCAVCRGERVDAAADLGPSADPADAGHHAVAERESFQRLAALLEQHQVCIEWQELKTLDADALKTLAEYCGQPDAAVIPQILAERSHIAAEPIGDEQACEVCGMTLMDISNLPDGAEPTRPDWYPVGAVVGLDCDGKDADDEEPEADAEPARILPMRGSRKRAGKTSPEAEQAAQVAAAADQTDDDPDPAPGA